MNEYYSQFPAPPLSKIKETLFDDIKREKPDVDDTKLKYIIENVLVNITTEITENCIGSHSSWMMHFRPKWNREILTIVENSNVDITNIETIHTQSI